MRALRSDRLERTNAMAIYRDDTDEREARINTLMDEVRTKFERLNACTHRERAPRPTASEQAKRKRPRNRDQSQQRRKTG